MLLSSNGNTNNQGALGKSVNAAYLTAPTTPDAYNGLQSLVSGSTTRLCRRSWNGTVEVQQEVAANMVVTGLTLRAMDTTCCSRLTSTGARAVPGAKRSGTSGRTHCFGPINRGNMVPAAPITASPTTTRCKLTVSQRLSRGLQFQANYVWSHMLDTALTPPDGAAAREMTTTSRPYNPAANYGASNFDVRNAFKTAVLYDLPFGKGQQFLNSNRCSTQQLVDGRLRQPSSGPPAVRYTVTMSYR